MPKLPGVNHLRAVKAFERAGFWIARQKKHIAMTDGERIITIPRENPVDAYYSASAVIRVLNKKNGTQMTQIFRIF